MQTSFGQGETLVTPLQNALIVQAVTNKGVMYEPYLVKNVMSVNKKNLYEYDGSSGGKYYGNVMSETEADMLAEHLKEVVEVGFSHVFGDASYTAAGKSGTAQFGTEGHEHSLFVGYMPYENPEIIVSVIMEDFSPDTNGDVYAVNVAKAIFDAYYSKQLGQND